MKDFERVYKNEGLVRGWRGIGPARTWWFDLSEPYPKRDTLDGAGVPISWDDDSYPVEQTRECTGDDTCTVILSDKDKKAVVIINRDLDYVLIEGDMSLKVTWDDYNTEGLWAVKKHCPGFKAEAVAINPKIKTLERYKLDKDLIQKIVEVMHGKKEEKKESPKKPKSVKKTKSEPAPKQDEQDQKDPAAA